MLEDTNSLDGAQTYDIGQIFKHLHDKLYRLVLGTFLLTFSFNSTFFFFFFFFFFF